MKNSILSIVMIVACLIFNKSVLFADTLKDKTYLAVSTIVTVGDYNTHSYRVPSLITTKTGVLVFACEARRESWKDKSPTEIIIRRSLDNGQTWERPFFLTNQANEKYAYMDPCLLLDEETGKVYLFACRWDSSKEEGLNVPYMWTSDDEGANWSSAKDMKSSFINAGGTFNGFGPGAGIQMKGDKYKGRLIVPTRQRNSSARMRNRTVYSDDNGLSWEIGKEGPRTGEYQISEIGDSRLYYNLRMNGKRAASYSMDGGVSWPYDIIMEKELPSIEKGCQASVWSSGNTILFTGIQGGKPTTEYDDRSMFTIYRSLDGGVNWNDMYLLYEKAAGYSCITQLKDGRFAIVFEAGDESGFSKKADRSKGWMRMDLLILPKEIITSQFWLDQSSSIENNTEFHNNDSHPFYLSQDKKILHIKGGNAAFVKIYSLKGQLLETIHNTQEVPLNDLPSGMYIVNIDGKINKISK